MSLQTSEASNSAFAPPPLHLLEEISHRVANEYAEAIATLRLAAAGAGDPQVGATLGGLAKQMRAYADAHRALLSPASGGLVDLADYVCGVCASMTKATLAPHGVHLLITTDEIWLDSGRAWRVGLVLAELVRNAARHGLGGGPGVIGVSIGNAGGQVTCQVSDNGGRGGGFQPGHGCRLVQALAAELGGSVQWWFAPAGCHVRLEFPADIAPLS